MTMATLKEIVQFYVAREATSIHTLKTEAISWRTVEAFAYVSADGVVQSERPEAFGTPGSGWEFKKVERREQTGYINPRHPSWPAYRRAKRRASLMLTARLLLKLGAGTVPSPDAVRHARREGLLSHHAGRGRRAASHVAAAYRALRKLANRAERASERFAGVDAWVAARQTEARGAER
jgi:hypothetical protein